MESDSYIALIKIVCSSIRVNVRTAHVGRKNGLCGETPWCVWGGGGGREGRCQGGRCPVKMPPFSEIILRGKYPLEGEMTGKAAWGDRGGSIVILQRGGGGARCMLNHLWCAVGPLHSQKI